MRSSTPNHALSSKEKILLDTFLSVIGVNQRFDTVELAFDALIQQLQNTYSHLENISETKNTDDRQLGLLKIILQWLHHNIADATNRQRLAKAMHDFIETIPLSLLVNDFSILRLAVRAQYTDLALKLSSIYELNDMLHPSLLENIQKGICNDLDICAVTTGNIDIINAIGNLYSNAVYINSNYSILSEETILKIQKKLISNTLKDDDKQQLLHGINVVNHSLEQQNNEENAEKLKIQHILLTKAIENNDDISFKTLLDKYKIIDVDLIQDLLKTAIHAKSFDVVRYIIFSVQKINWRCLSSEELAIIIKNVTLSFEMNQDIINNMMTNDLIKHHLTISFLAKQNNNSINILPLLLTKHSENIFNSVSQDNLNTLLPCLLAMGADVARVNQLITTYNADILKIYIIARSYPQSQFSIDEVKTLDCVVRSEHIMLAKKCNDEQMQHLISNLAKQQKLANNVFNEEQNEDIKLIQGAIFTYERINKLYPIIYNNIFDYTSCLHTKYTEMNEFIKNTNGLFYVWMHQLCESHRVSHTPSKQLIALPEMTTSQYVSAQQNFASILENGHLYSQHARKNKMGITDGTSILTKNDKEVWDDKLVCTSPYKVENYELAYYAKINLNLSTIPLSYLKHAIIKLGDFHIRMENSDAYDNIYLTPDITMSCTMHTHDKVNYIFHDNSINKRIQFSLSASDELFHGLKGFEAIFWHLFFVLSHLKQQTDSQPYIEKIISYFIKLESKETLTNHLNTIFAKLFRHIEIDFQNGLPLSFDYIPSIEFKNNKILDMNILKQLLIENNLDQLKQLFLQFPELTQYPFCVSEILRLTPAYNIHDVSELINSLSPEAYLAYQYKLHENYKKTIAQTIQQVNQLASSQQITLKYDLYSVLHKIKHNLADNCHDDFRKTLISKYKADVANLCALVKSMYKNIEFSGNDAKMRQVLMDPRIVREFTDINRHLLLAIFAYEIEAKKNFKPFCPDTYICKTTSQATGEKLTVSLGNILLYGFSQPTIFFESIPSNEKYLDNLQKQLQRYIKQKTLTVDAFKKWEDICLELYHLLKNDVTMTTDQVLLQHSAAHPLLHEDFINTDRLATLITYVNADDFCSNPDIVDEVNEGLTLFLKNIFQKNKITNDNGVLVFSKSITLNELVEQILLSTTILNTWPIAHLLFDRLHFGLALTNSEVYTIEYSDQKEPISFYRLINLIIKKLSDDRDLAHIKYPIMYEQLSLRIAMLDDWCIKNDKYSSPNDITNNQYDP